MSESNHTEILKPVPRYEGHYSVSGSGNVRRDLAGVGAVAGRILSPRIRKGYLCVNLYRDNAKKTFSVHSLVAAAFIGPRPDGLEINHKNGDKNDNSHGNLEYVTPSQNITHAIRVTRSISNPICIGAANGRTKFSDADVVEMRRLHSQGEATLKSIAARYKTSSRVINDIVTRRRRKSVA